MISKEQLNDYKELAEVGLVHLGRSLEIKQCELFFEQIKKDLEVLEILTKYLTIDVDIDDGKLAEFLMLNIEYGIPKAEFEKISNYIKTAKYTIKYIKGGPVNENI